MSTALLHRGDLGDGMSKPKPRIDLWQNGEGILLSMSLAGDVRLSGDEAFGGKPLSPYPGWHPG